MSEAICPKCNVEFVETINVLICPICYDNYLNEEQQAKLQHAAQYMSVDKIKVGMQEISDEERQLIQEKQERAQFYDEIINNIFKSKSHILSSIARTLETDDPVKALMRIVDE
jgi:uncharacterized Zn finger protein (UPF0148 family)